MAKNTASIPAKITGSTYSAAEFEILRGFVDSPLQDLSTFDGSLILLDGSGSYDNFTMSANLEITFAESAHVEGNGKIVLITADGIKTLTLTKPSAYELYYPSTLTSGAALASGIHELSFWFIRGAIQTRHIPLTKSSGDVTAPTMTSRTIENAAPLDMVMVFDEVVTGTNLGFTIAGTTSTAFASISGSGTNTITGTMAVAAVFGETITLDYSSVSGDIVDGNSNALVTFSGAAVTNNVADATAPTVSTMTVEDANPNDLVVTLDESCTFTNVGYTFRVDSTPRTLTSVSGSPGTVATFLISGAAITNGQVLDLAYDSGTGDTTRVSNSVELVTFTATSVTNNVASAWTPADLEPDLTLWLDATVGVTEAGTGVSLWEDQSSNGRDFAQGTDANRPTYNTDEIIFVQANTDLLEIVGSTTAAWVKDFHDGTLTIYDICMKVKANSLTGSNGLMGTNAGASGNLGFRIRINADGSLSNMVSNGVDSAGNLVNDVTSAAFIAEDTYTWIRFYAKILDTTPADKSVIYNESTSESNNIKTNVTPNGGNASFDVQIGAVGDDLQPGDISIKEIIITDRILTAQEWIDIKLR